MALSSECSAQTVIRTQYSLLLFPDVGKCPQIFSLDSHRTALRPWLPYLRAATPLENCSGLVLSWLYLPSTLMVEPGPVRKPQKLEVWRMKGNLAFWRLDPDISAHSMPFPSVCLAMASLQLGCWAKREQMQGWVWGVGRENRRQSLIFSLLSLGH